MDEGTLAIFIPILAIGLGCTIPIVIIVAEYFVKKGKLRVMERAIEKGLSLEGLSLEGPKAPRVPYRSGMVFLAVGLGIGILTVSIRQMAGLGVAAIPALIGAVLIINDRINYDRLFNTESDPQYAAE
jgi:hypothetical protein